MKKLFTFMAAAAVAVCSQATVLWEGNVVYTGWTADVEGGLVLPATDFATAQVGDKVVVNIKDVGAKGDTWCAVQLYQSDFSGVIPGCDQHVTAADTKASFTLTDASLNIMKASGMALAGTGYTATKISLESDNGVVWEGECTCADWHANPPVRLLGSAFVSAKLGDNLVFTCHKINPDAWGAIQIDNGMTYSPGIFGMVELGPDQTEVRIQLDQAKLTELQADGINITGANFILTKIAIVSGADEPMETGLIWQGDASCVDWTMTPPVNLAGSNFDAAKVGDFLAFYVSIINPEEWAGIEVDNSKWTKGAFADTRDITAETTVVEYALSTQALVDELKADGINVTGANFKLTKIKLNEESGINDITVDAAEADVNAPVYNLQGQRVASSLNANLPAGIYLQSGRKVIVK